MGSHGQHGDTMPNMKAVKVKPQGDGRKYLGHVITAIVTFTATLASAMILHTGTPGAQGPSGPAGGTVVKAPATAGVCAYFGPDPTTGHVRLQLSQPLADGNGAYCPKGTFIGVIPRR